MRDRNSTRRLNTRALLKWISFAAATVLTATAEHDLFTLMGADELLAWAFPIMLDCYCAYAFMDRSTGNVRAALTLMIGCQAIAHLLDPHAGVHPALVIAISAVPPIILWRIHSLDHHHTHDSTPASASTPTPAGPVDAVASIAKPPAVEPSAAPTAMPGAAPARRRQTGRTREQTRAAIHAIRAEHPGITQTAIATRLGVTDRWVRACLATA